MSYLIDIRTAEVSAFLDNASTEARARYDAATAYADHVTIAAEVSSSNAARALLWMELAAAEYRRLTVTDTLTVAGPGTDRS